MALGTVSTVVADVGRIEDVVSDTIFGVIRALIAVGLGYRGFFTSAQQLREPPPDPPVG